MPLEDLLGNPSIIIFASPVSSLPAPDVRVILPKGGLFRSSGRVGLSNAGYAPVVRRFEAGDPLRGLAALAVVVFHLTIPAFAGHQAPYGPVMSHVFPVLSLGIYVFFALSAYLLSRPFIAAFHRGEPMPWLSGYLVNRLLRIVPAFWVVAGSRDSPARIAGKLGPATRRALRLPAVPRRGPCDPLDGPGLDARRGDPLLLPASRRGIVARLRSRPPTVEPGGSSRPFRPSAPSRRSRSPTGSMARSVPIPARFRSPCSTHSRPESP